MRKLKTYVYVDGMNLYYGALKNSAYRWLNIAKMCELLLPPNEISKIKYFTANVKSRPEDLEQPIRQQTYLRALRTIPNCTIIYGHFLSHVVRMPLANPVGSERFADVVKTEEKGSDVNLATHLLCDGFAGAYEVAVIVSNDSDLAEPVRIVREELEKTIGILNPHRYPSLVLSRHSQFLKQIRTGVLRESQFPPVLQDSHGSFHKPASW